MQNVATPIRILIVDDHVLVRRGLVALLNDRHDIDVVGEAADGFEAIETVADLKPDVILMDLEMPRLGGIAAMERIKRDNPDNRFLVITNFDDDDLVLAAVQAGANGYLLKTTTPEILLEAIRLVDQGGAPLDPAITHIVLSKLSEKTTDTRSATDPLTEREITVLQLLAEGHTDRAIATILSISVRTVSTHVHSILNKLDLENRTQAALWAIRQGLVELE